MKTYCKPEIKVKAIVMQPLMEMSEIEILQNIINPEYSQSKLQDMFWDLAEEE